MAKCPKCESSVTRMNLEHPKAVNRDGKEFSGIVFLCPSCSTVLGATIDPVLLANQVIQAVKGAR